MRLHQPQRVNAAYVAKLVTPTTFFWALYFRARGRKATLLNLEPCSSYPPNHSLWARAFNERVKFGTAEAPEAVRWPIDDSLIHDPGLGNESRIEAVVLIASNRCGASSLSNYALRRSCVASRESLPIIVVGQGWRDSWKSKVVIALKTALFSAVSFKSLPIRELVSYVTFKPQAIDGIHSKRDFLKSYRYSLVIENESTYVSEKLIEALLLGTKPIYIGPQIPESWVPSSLYLRSEPNMFAISDSIRRLKLEDFAAHLKSLDEWVASGSASLWSRKDLLEHRT